jgi:predicted DsbA family dithiol-disulfide isomerase
VQQDIAEAQTLGIQGVPFFVLDRKYAVSGAQSAETFMQVLEKAYAEWQQENKNFTTIEGNVCTPDGDCK